MGQTLSHGTERSELLIIGQDMQSTLDRGKCCLVGKIMSEKCINYDAFKNMLFKVRNINATATNIMEVGTNLFLFEFVFEGELFLIWDGQPWLFG